MAKLAKLLAKKKALETKLAKIDDLQDDLEYKINKLEDERDDVSCALDDVEEKIEELEAEEENKPLLAAAKIVRGQLPKLRKELNDATMDLIEFALEQLKKK